MKMKIKTVYTILFFLTLLSPFQARAENISVPENMQGIWAAPNCENSMTFMILSERFLIEAMAITSLFYRIHDIVDQDRYISVKLYDTAIFVQKPVSEFLNISRTSPHEKNSHQDLTQYQRCNQESLKNWKSLDKNALALLKNMDDWDSFCDGKIIESDYGCQQATFALFDHDKNGVLDHAELAALWAQTNYYFGAITCEFEHVFSDQTKKDGIQFVNEIMPLFDHDHSGSLSLEEIQNSWEQHKLSPAAVQFMEYTDILSDYFHFIPHYPENIRKSHDHSSQEHHSK